MKEDILQKGNDILNQINKDSLIKDILDLLPNSEYLLIQYMVEKNVSQNKEVPLAPEGFDPKVGSIEFGLFLYWFHNVELLTLKDFSLEEKILIQAFIFALSIGLKKSKFNSDNYEYLCNENEKSLIYTDGTVLGTKTYANYDQGWFTAFLNLFITVKDNLWYNDLELPSPAAPPIVLKGAKENEVSIAIIGDWGANNQASKDVMNHLKNLSPKPDYIVHVGDVYYAGTPLKSPKEGDKYLSPGQEHQNMITSWPKEYIGKSFTLNSNHEMYSGANGLFHDALLSENSPFSLQKGKSMFSLTYADWNILGLDTAFRSSIFHVFMKGSIGGTNEYQSKWISELNLNAKKTILLTHHNGFADDCTSVLPLWGEIRKALKDKDPYAWYWGHVHNGIVYKPTVSIPYNEKGEAKFCTNTFARCLGHAALPYGQASSLSGPEAKPQIEWKADNLKKDHPNELYNGYAVITLNKSSNNELESIHECFYDLSDQPQPVYSKPLYPYVS